MKICVKCLLFFVVASNTLAQTNNTDYLHNRALLERLNSNSYGLTNSTIPSLPMAPPSLVGDVYLTQNFNSTIFQLYKSDSYIEGYGSKLDLSRNEFDLMTTKGVQVLDGSKVKTFAYIDSITSTRCSFVNTKEFRAEDGTPIKQGFFQIVSDGNMPLLLLTEVIIKKATYNPTLDVGKKNHTYIKKEKLYYLKDNKVIAIPKKKQMLDIFGDAKPAVVNYTQTNGLDLGKKRDLVFLFDYYNSTAGK